MHLVPYWHREFGNEEKPGYQRQTLLMQDSSIRLLFLSILALMILLG